MSEKVIIGGGDFSDTDAEARRIMELLSDHPTTPIREDRQLPSLRVLINMILKAHQTPSDPRITFATAITKKPKG